MPDLQYEVLIAQLNHLVNSGRQTLKEYKAQLEQESDEWNRAYSRGYNKGMNRVLTDIENILDNQDSQIQDNPQEPMNITNKEIKNYKSFRKQLKQTTQKMAQRMEEIS